MIRNGVKERSQVALRVARPQVEAAGPGRDRHHREAGAVAALVNPVLATPARAEVARKQPVQLGKAPLLPAGPVVVAA